MANIERRIAQYRWDELNEDEQNQVKLFTREYAKGFGYDHEFEYYWMMFEQEQWLLANLTDPEAARHFR